MDIRTARPLSRQQLDDLAGGRWQVHAAGKPRGRTLQVSVVMDATDAIGALIRSCNLVLDIVPGEITHAEITEMRPRPQRS
jgi:hypothetical protein